MIPNNSIEEDAAKKYSKLFVFSGGNKAGMEAMDKDKQAQVIYEMSKNSAYFKRATRLDEITTQKAEQLKKQFDLVDESVNPVLCKRLSSTVTSRCVELEKRRRFNQICCVLDMDMFYAAVEIRDQPHLKDLPVAVGGNSMISTSNYVARKFGVRAAMPGFIAKKLCPNLVFVNCNFDKYQIVADQIRSIIREYDPYFQSHSLDEVYFDLTAASKRRFFGHDQPMHHQMGVDGSVTIDNEELITTKEGEGEDEAGEEDGDHSDNQNRSISYMPASSSAAACAAVDTLTDVTIVQLRAVAHEILHEIRQRIKSVTGGLTSSAGIANNFFLAKICADMNKPDGQYELAPTREAVMEFVSNLPTRKVGGIGKVTEKMLETLGMKTMGDVRVNLHRIIHTFTPTSSDFLMRVSLGIAQDEGVEKLKSLQFNKDQQDGQASSNSTTVVTRKSIGCERTYSAKGICDREELLQRLHYICEQVHADMVKENLYGKTVTVKLKDTDFNLHTKCQSCPSGTYSIQSVESIEQIAKPILLSSLPMKVRLLGVSVSKFKNSANDTNNKFSGSSSSNVLNFFTKQQQQQKDPNVRVNQETISKKETSLNPICIVDLVDDEDEIENHENLKEPIDVTEAMPTERFDTQIEEDDDMLFMHEFSQEEKKSGLQDDCDTEGDREGENQHRSDDEETSGGVFSHNKEKQKEEDRIEIIELYTPPDPITSINTPQPLEKKAQDQLSCPICMKVFDTNSLSFINSHVDSCLVRMSRTLPSVPSTIQSHKRKVTSNNDYPNSKGQKVHPNSIITAFFKCSK